MDAINDSGSMNALNRTCGYCFDCRHELIETGSNVCPECGHWFDAGDARTFYRRRPGLLACLMMKPTRWLSALFGLALALLILCAFSIPGGYFVLGALAILVWVIAIFGLAIDLIVSIVVSWRMGRSWLFEVSPTSKKRRIRRSQLRWLIAPALLVVAVVLVTFDVPAQLAFWASEEDLLELVEGKSKPEMPGYVGLLPVASVNGDTVWLSDGGGFMVQVGFAYLPHIQSDVIELSDGVRGWRYSGDWFLVEQQF